MPLKLARWTTLGRAGSLNHLGVEVDGISAVDAEQTRLAATGLDLADERDTTCSYAKQDKFWVKDARTASPGSSTPSWRTARPSTARMAARPAAADRPDPPQKPPQ